MFPTDCEISEILTKSFEDKTSFNCISWKKMILECSAKIEIQFLDFDSTQLLKSIKLLHKIENKKYVSYVLVIFLTQVFNTQHWNISSVQKLKNYIPWRVQASVECSENLTPRTFIPPFIPSYIFVFSLHTIQSFIEV